MILPGQVRRISVAVMVDGVSETGADGAPAWAPRPAEELDTLRDLVRSAIGFDAARGDIVTISSLQFTLPAELGSLAERAGTGFLAAQGARLAQIGVLGAIVLALIFFVLRPMLGRRPPMRLAELAGPGEYLADQARLIGGPVHVSGDLLDLPPQSLTKIDRLREVIASRSEDSAAVLRSWIESPDARKEPAGS